MPEWKFKISGHVNIPGNENGKPLNLYPENFKSFNRVSNYLDKNMPMILTHLTVDKNLFDIIIKYAKIETIYIKIEKFNTQDDMQEKSTVTYIEDEFSVILSHDINYNKEIDYMETESDSLTPDNAREDIYRDVSIGLISKKSIDANKVVANTVIYDSTMFDIVCSYMNELHLLIEPFDYNVTKAQLPIPPQDTLTKLIKYLNSVNVFYSTKYELFIDEPYCTYLLSRSGKGVEKSDDKYLDVYIEIISSDDNRVVEQGMVDDETKKHHYVSVPAVATKYTIDHDASKMVNQIDTIVNPNPINGIESNSAVQWQVKQINKIIGSFRDYVHKFSHNVGNITEKIEQQKMSFNATLQDYMKPTFGSMKNIASTSVSSQMGSIPSSVGFDVGELSIDFPLVQSGIAGTIFGGMGGCFGHINTSIGKTDGINSRFKNISEKMLPQYYKADYLDNFLGAVTPINAQDVIKGTNSMISSLKSASSAIHGLNISGITNQLGHINSAINQVQKFTGHVDRVVKTMETIEKAQYFSQFCGNYPNIKGTMDCIKDNARKMNNLSSKMVQYCNRATSIANTFTGIVNQLNDFGRSVNGFTDSLGSIFQLDLKSNFTSIVPKITSTIGKAESAMQAFNNISSTINKGTLSYENLKNLQKNLNQITDISNIGSFGLSDFGADLQIGGCFGDGKIGTKIVKARNDNPNEIKNIKSEVETMINQLSISKEGIDPSVFTPNKKYTINNYDAHSDKDGIFILNKKTEVYQREDENFVCTTFLDFAKIVEESTKDAATDTSVTKNDTQYTDWYKQSKGQMVDSSKTVNVDRNGNGGLVGRNYPKDNPVTRNDAESVLTSRYIMH